MKQKITCTLIVCLILVFMEACQPTPEKPVVIEKNGDMEQKIMQTAEPQQPLQTDQRWEESLDFQSGVQVYIDAEVEIPDVFNFPVVEVKPHEFTQQEVQKFVDYFMQGQPLYEFEFVQTKDDIMEYIISARAELAKAENGTYDSEDSRQKDINMYTQALKYYEAEYEKAPEKAPELKPATVEFKKADNSVSGTEREIFLQAFLEGGSRAYLGVLIQDNKQSIITFVIISNVHFTGDLDATNTLAGVKITRQEAQTKADELLKGLGIMGLQLSSTKVHVEMAGLLSPDSIKDISDPETKKCFEFNYTWLYDNIPISDVRQFYGMESENVMYDKPWDPEEVIIMVNDDGVIKFEWDSPGDIVNVVNDNVKLMSFDHIKEIFRKQIFYQKTWGDPNQKNTITVKKAKLGLMRVKIKDENRYMLMPVWDFIGDFSDGSGFDLNDVSFLTINAIDGSVINRYLGY